VYIPVTAGILTALGNGEYAASPNFECPRSECRADDIAILGVCSQCSTHTILNTNFDDCKVDFTYGFNQGLPDEVIKDGTYQELLHTLNNLQTEGLYYDLTWLLCEQRPANFPSMSLQLNVQLTSVEVLRPPKTDSRPPKTDSRPPK
jgi:hypothetical protein